jgi:hypothetical protein
VAYAPAPSIAIAGRTISPTPVFDTYWRFAYARQQVYDARQKGEEGPWTDDPVLLSHRFTNCYRASDRVSQFLIKDVIYTGDQATDEVTFRVLLFKFFNRIETWNLLVDKVGSPSWASFDAAAYDRVLSAAMAKGQRIYSAAYVMPAPHLGAARKHTNHLRLLARMFGEGLPDKLGEASTMETVYKLLLSYPSMGPFLAFQFATDLNYSTVINFDEMEFVVAGPGARDGLRKCFGDAAKGIEADLIRYVAEHQDEHFERLGLDFMGLRGRPLQLIDCQNLFCETDKYARVVHPDVAGYSGRSRIKQRFNPAGTPTPGWFPPKWGINLEESDSPLRVATDLDEHRTHRARLNSRAASTGLFAVR